MPRLMSAASTAAASGSPTIAEPDLMKLPAFATGVDAFIYGYPLVMMGRDGARDDACAQRDGEVRPRSC